MKEILIIGKKAILDAIKNKSLQRAIISNHDQNFYVTVKQFLGKKLIINNDKNFYNKKISKFCNHQCAIGYIKNNLISNLNDLFANLKTKNESTILFLDSIHDPYNFGSIIRTAESFGIDAIIYRKDRQCQITPQVAKISSGAISNISLIDVTNLVSTINKFKEIGYWVYASCLDKAANNLTSIKFAKKTILIIGNEDKGVSKLLLNNSDFKVKINIFGKTQSFNAAIATSIFLYAKSCQK